MHVCMYVCMYVCSMHVFTTVNQTYYGESIFLC